MPLMRVQCIEYLSSRWREGNSSDGGDRMNLFGLKFLFLGCFWTGKFGKYFLGGLS